MIFLERLRSETKHIHQGLEKAMIPGIKNATTLEDYSRILQIFYGYFKALETQLDNQLSDSIVPHYSNRRKADLILQDLKAMNEKFLIPTVAAAIPAITNVHQALGAMYVLEGSTLGGRIITKMLTQSLQLQDSQYLKFFNGYGDQTDAMWGSFLGVLNQYATDESKQDLIVHAAIDTFSSFKNWIETNEKAAV